MAVLGLAPDDDDGAAASVPAQRQRATPRQPAGNRPQADNPEVPPTLRMADARSAKLHATLNDAGIKARDKKIDYCSHVIGRRIESSSEMTAAETSQVIDRLNMLIEEQINDLRYEAEDPNR